MPTIEEKKKTNALIPAAAVATGGAVAGMGFVDLRKSIKKDRAKHLGNTWDQVRKHIQPGDIAIGAPVSAQTIHRNVVKSHGQYAEDIGRILEGKKAKHVIEPGMYNRFVKDSPKWAPNFLRKNIAAAKIHFSEYGELDMPTVLSKFHNKSESHGELFVTKNKVMFAGGGVRTPVAAGMIRKDKKHAIQHRKDFGRTDPHYIVIRPKDPANNLMLQYYKKHGAKKASEHMKSRVGYYNTPMSIGGWAKDALLPKFNSKEKEYTSKELTKNRNCRGGVCSTAPATMSRKTVGGKKIKDILPNDYIKSPENYKIVGRIGKPLKTSWKWKALLNAPKIALRAGAGMAAGGAVYAGAKGISHLLGKKPMEKQAAYEFGMIDEIRKIFNSSKIS
jgi:hypothetical protein